MIRWGIVASLGLIAGCGGQAASASSGGNGGGGGSGATGGSSGSAASGGSGGSGGSIDGGAGDASLVGTWKGYVEAHTFSSGSDAVALVITDGAPNGRIVFGQGTPPPPATDPDVGYPPGEDAGFMSLPFEGFEHTLQEGNVSGDRVRFKVSTRELWKVWCALQTPFETDLGSGSYGCLPNWGYSTGPSGCEMQNPDTGESVQVDCGKLELCGMAGVCECTASGCEAAQFADIAFDLDHVGNELDGSITLSGVKNVRLDKQ
jgi:hypothetical protein